MVSPRTPVMKRYGPSKSAGTRTDLIRARIEPGLIDTGLITDDVEEMYGGYMRKNEIDRNDFDTEPEEDEIFSDEVLVQRALAAFRRAESRRDGLVEMEEREWQAWNRHQAIEREIEKRVMERERERQWEMMEMDRQRQMDPRKASPARSERTHRSPSVSRTRSGSGTRNRSGSGAGAYGSGVGNVGEPGFLADNSFTPLGYSSSANSSPKISYSSAAPSNRPYRSQTRDSRMIASSEIDHHVPPRYARDINPSHSSLSATSFAHPRVSVPLYSTTSSSYKAGISPSSFLEPASSTSPYRRSNALGRNVGSTVSLPPGSSYHPGMHPSIPSSSSMPGFVGSDREDSSSGGGGGRSRIRRGM
ncbi:hypothetical protein L873DRAFT_1831241 [Choiromyces venosus 120613-1]|uniref:Uncharacterized protein n=1 Tax=Choiromyces venosus 120613-1 TaxID=1336337 RepID=A0A3N4J134_9PEZI|nr:hypothetical protein L873DRAFT_1831241 [Choiromyces venosus 120613-1]